MIHGSLKSFNFLEVLQFVSRKRGSLWVDSPEGSLKIYLDSGNITGFIYGDERVRDIFRARGIIYRFLKSPEGRFKFLPEENGIRDFSVPVEVFILSVVSMGDELQQIQMTSLVHPDTVYVLSENGPADLPEGDIREFLETTYPFFQTGSSATRISRETGMDLEVVLKFMTVLEAGGVVKPLFRSKGRRDTPLIGRVLNVLKKVWAWGR